MWTLETRQKALGPESSGAEPWEWRRWARAGGAPHLLNDQGAAQRAPCPHQDLDTMQTHHAWSRTHSSIPLTDYISQPEPRHANPRRPIPSLEATFQLPVTCAARLDAGGLARVDRLCSCMPPTLLNPSERYRWGGEGCTRRPLDSSVHQGGEDRGSGGPSGSSGKKCPRQLWPPCPLDPR